VTGTVRDFLASAALLFGILFGLVAVGTADWTLLLLAAVMVGAGLLAAT